MLFESCSYLKYATYCASVTGGFPVKFVDLFLLFIELQLLRALLPQGLVHLLEYRRCFHRTHLYLRVVHLLLESFFATCEKLIS